MEKIPDMKLFPMGALVVYPRSELSALEAAVKSHVVLGCAEVYDAGTSVFLPRILNSFLCEYVQQNLLEERCHSLVL